MELHNRPTETPTRASSCSMDPLYDNCVPFALRGRAREKEKEVESGVVCPAVTRPPGPCSPLPGLAPAAEVPALVSGGRGIGPWPDHNYHSWRGGLGTRGLEAEQDANRNGTMGGEGERQGGGGEGRAPPKQSPSSPQSERHRSALSLYDNLCDTVTPDRLQEVSVTETIGSREQMYRARAPEEIQGVMDDEGADQDASPWSSCEIVLAQSGSDRRDHDAGRDEEHEREPELDPGSRGFRQGDTMRQCAANFPQLSQTECLHILWPSAEAQHVEQTSQSPMRMPPPVPQADPSASALRSLVTSLQQQIVRQREEYEARIISLEQRNEELQAEVVGLKANLAQQQHWYQVVQARIVESEKSRAAAELRNATLQKEMEQLFDTFGELNNEAKKTECIVKSF